MDKFIGWGDDTTPTLLRSGSNSEVISIANMSGCEGGSRDRYVTEDAWLSVILTGYIFSGLIIDDVSSWCRVESDCWELTSV